MNPMKRVAITSALLSTGGLIWLVAQNAATANRPLPSLFPPHAALYLEAKNFGELLTDWNASKEKQLWLASDNYEIFSRSNLALKLEKAQQEFAAAAGIPPNMALLSNVAGTESALAIYDIGALEFLYVTRLPSARITNSPLWQKRGSYESRQAAGLGYYVKTDRQTGRVAAFAAARDYLVLGTREDLVAGAMTLLSGENAASLAGEPWFTQPIQAAKAPGDLRLVLNMPLLLQSPYMRSYWIQRNATELKRYSTVLSDLNRQPTAFTEDRLLFRAIAEQPSWNENALAQIVRMAPANAGLYRAWASPGPDQAFELIRAKILDPRASHGPESLNAPEVRSPDAATGTEADLEIRIDEPPLDSGRRTVPEALRKMLDANKPDAMMYVGQTRILPDGVFVGIDSAVVLLGGSSWDRAAIQSALTEAGAAFDGPGSIAVAAKGNALVIATRPELTNAILNNAGPARPPARYAAFYRHGRELGSFLRLTGLLDNTMRSDQPSFFSQNVGSFGASVLGRLDMASITVHDSGATITQNILYRLKP